MRVLCQYSGVEFTVSGFRNLFLREETAHPLMFADLKILTIEAAKEYIRGTLSKEEERVLFCALLKQTDLVEFLTPAAPEVETIKKTMDRLILTAGWINVTGLSVFPIPKVTIRKETKDCTHIQGWLDAVNDAKKDWQVKGTSWSLGQKLALREAALLKLIRSPARKEDTYARQMAKYFLEATSAPPYIHAYWIELFALKENSDIWKTPSVDLEELYEHMVLHLDRNTIIGADAFSRIERIIYINKRGVEGGIGLDDDDFFATSIHAPKFTIIRSLDSKPLTVSASAFSSTEEHNIQVAIASAPKSKPVPEDYPTKVAYLRAEAAWRIAERAKLQQKVIEKRREEMERELLTPGSKEEDMTGDAGNLDEEVKDQLRLFDLTKKKTGE